MTDEELIDIVAKAVEVHINDISPRTGAVAVLSALHAAGLAVVTIDFVERARDAGIFDEPETDD